MKRYIFHCPVTEIWVIEVFAKSKSEAWKKFASGQMEQLDSYSGSTKSGNTELINVSKINGDKNEKAKRQKKK